MPAPSTWARSKGAGVPLCSRDLPDHGCEIHGVVCIGSAETAGAAGVQPGCAEACQEAQGGEGESIAPGRLPSQLLWCSRQGPGVSGTEPAGSWLKPAGAANWSPALCLYPRWCQDKVGLRPVILEGTWQGQARVLGERRKGRSASLSPLLKQWACRCTAFCTGTNRALCSLPARLRVETTLAIRWLGSKASGLQTGCLSCVDVSGGTLVQAGARLQDLSQSL